MIAWMVSLRDWAKELGFFMLESRGIATTMRLSLARLATVQLSRGTAKHPVEPPVRRGSQRSESNG